jgi:hypothetical protein
MVLGAGEEGGPNAFCFMRAANQGACPVSPCEVEQSVPPTQGGMGQGGDAVGGGGGRCVGFTAK